MSMSGYIYWTDQGAQKVQRANLDGNDIVDLQTGLSIPKGLGLHIPSGHVYWTDISADQLRRCDFDGSNTVLILSGVFQGIEIDTENGYLYATHNPARTQVSRYDLDGSNSTIIISGLSGIPSAERTFAMDVALDVNNDKLYWVETRSPDGITSSGFIGHANLDGSSSGTLISASDLTTVPFVPFTATLDNVNNKLYWTNAASFTIDQGSICRSNLDGSNIEILISGLNRPHGLTVDTNNGNMYFTEVLLGTIHRCKLDGSDIITVVSGVSNPQWIAVDSTSGTEPAIDLAASGNLYICGFASYIVSDMPIRIIHRLTKTGDYNPQLISTFNNIPPISVNIEIWDIVDGQGTKIILANNGCYAIGNTSAWGWSTEHLPFTQEHKRYHYYFRMISNEGEAEYGEFFITVPECGRWSYPD